MLFQLSTILVSVLLAICCYFYYKCTYWTRRGIPQENPLPIVGNYGKMLILKRNIGQITEKICKKFPDAPVIGMYFGTQPGVIVKDPELIKYILQKDFYYFNGREALGYNEIENGTKNIFNIEGDHWKILRTNLTPLFSSGKMKQMFHLIKERTKDLEVLIKKQAVSSKSHEIRWLMARYTMDCIGSCFFGIETDTMGDDVENNPFDRIRDIILNIETSNALKLVYRVVYPKLFYRLGFEMIPKEVMIFFEKLVDQVFSERNNEPGTRGDFMDAMLTIKNNKIIEGDRLVNPKDSKAIEEKITMPVTNKILATQSLAFFTGGFETSSGTLTNTLFELAKNKEAQKRLHADIDEYLKARNGELEYDCVTELPYLEACVYETLRLYPVLGVLTRQAAEDYTLPNGLKLERGSNVLIPLFYLHRVPEYFPKPDEYIPERFLPENRGNIKSYTFFPFGDGPRVCIGTRFAKMQVYAGMVTMLRSYRVELAESMPTSFEINPKIFLTMPKDGVYLKFIPRTEAL